MREGPPIFEQRHEANPGLDELLQVGDEANRQRSWGEAEVAYRAALAIDSSLAHIWVQYGHARKEQGHFRDAEEAYRNALSLGTAAGEIYLQLGQALKLQGQNDRAADAYIAAYRAECKLPGPRAELDALGIAMPPPAHDWAHGDTEPERILLANGLSGKINHLFDFRFYLYTNPEVQVVPEKPDRCACLAHFCAHGIDAMLQFNDAYRFDPVFYNETYIGYALSPSNAYWHWLSVGIEKGWHPNRTKWLSAKLGAENLTVDGFDFSVCAAFFYADYEEIGWADLFSRFIDDGVLVRPGPHLPVTAATADLFTAIADHYASTDRNEYAAALYAQVLASVPRHRKALLNCADCLQRLGLNLDAMRRHQQTIDFNLASRWCYLHQATYYENSGDFINALNSLRVVIEKYPAEIQLRSRLIKIAERFFWLEWGIAAAIARTGRYKEAQSRLASACDFIGLLLKTGSCLPSRPVSSVALVADIKLPQCKFYRVDQKLEHLEAAGFATKLYDFETDLQKFVDECAQHQAVIFYRLPSFPAVINAINRAKEMGLVTFYDIDDFIFGAENYPGSLESFFGEITLNDYIGLKLGVPCYRKAISLCHYGLASTPALADRLSGIVSSGQAFVHRNAFGSKQEKLSMHLPKKEPRDCITIFYGSGTKSHKEDFRDLIEPALVEIVEKYKDRIAIIFVGHLVLSPELEKIRDNLTIIGPLNVDQYWNILKDADINIAVLKQEPMTDCKSEIKWLEAAMFGIPTIASGTATHNEVIRPGVTGLICNTVDEWKEALDLLVRDGELRERIGTAAWHHVRGAYGMARMAQNLSSIFASATPAVGLPAKPRILIVNAFYPPQAIGGATRVVADNVSWLTEQYRDDFETAVFTTGWAQEENGEWLNYAQRSYAHGGVRVTSLSLPPTHEVETALFDPEIQRLFGDYLDQYRPALVHFHCIQRLTTSVVAAAADRGIPYLITAHDGWWISSVQFIVNEDDKPQLYDYANPMLTNRKWGGASYARMMQLKQALFGATKVLAVSEKFAELYRNCGVPNVIAVENGLTEMIQRKPRLPAADNRVRLGLLGGIGYAKGSDLIKYALLSHPFEHLRLTIVDSRLEVGDVRSELWNTTPVDFIPKVSEEYVGELYAKLDVVLAPSVCIESFGQTTREALHCGCWVIASDRGSIGDCVIPGENGYVVDVSSPVDLVRVLQLIDADPGRYRRPPTVTSQFRRSTDQTDELAALYRSVIESSAANEHTAISGAACDGVPSRPQGAGAAAMVLESDTRAEIGSDRVGDMGPPPAPSKLPMMQMELTPSDRTRNGLGNN